MGVQKTSHYLIIRDRCKFTTLSLSSHCLQRSKIGTAHALAHFEIGTLSAKHVIIFQCLRSQRCYTAINHPAKMGGMGVLRVCERRVNNNQPWRVKLFDRYNISWYIAQRNTRQRTLFSRSECTWLTETRLLNEWLANDRVFEIAKSHVKSYLL